MTGPWLALLLAALPPGCEQAALAAGWPPDRLAAEAPALAADAARAAPAVALQGLAAALAEAAPPGREVDAARFAAALAHHCRLAGLPPAARQLSPVERAALDRLLAEPRFTRARPLPDRLLEWLGRLWDRLADLLGTEEAEQVASRGRSAFFALAALVAGALAVASLRRRRLVRQVARVALAPAPPAAAAPAAPDAEAYLAAGRAGEAVRAALLGALAALEQAGRLPAGRALTNREAAERLLRSAPAAASAFELLAGAFDRTVYGRVEPSSTEAAACLAAARRLRAALAEATP